MGKIKEIIIEANKPIRNLWKELWTFRELFYILAWRDLLVQYKQTAIGVAWSVIRPLIAMVVFSFIFGKIAKLQSENVPYPILVYVGLLPWQFFNNTLTTSAESLITNANIISKIYFPRIIISSTSAIVSLLDFLISFCILLLLMLLFNVFPNWKIIFLPFFLILAVLTSLGLGYWISTLNVKYRDFRYVVPFIIQFSLFLSPVGFSSQIVPEEWKLLYSLNPLVGIIDGFRWCLLGQETQLYIPGVLLSFVLAFLFFFSGIWYFTKMERNFADLI